MAALAAGLAGCSSDFTRMSRSQNPWAAQPQASNEVTGSVHQPHAAPTHRVETSALPAPAPSSTPTYGGSAGIGSYQPPAQAQRPEYTGSVSAPPPRQPQAPAQHWSWDGGTAIVVAQGETIDSIARRHGVPASAILQANNMTHAAQLQPGQRLVIPRAQQQQQQQIGQAPQMAPPTTRVAGPRRSRPATAPTPSRPARRSIRSAAHYRSTPMAIAKANNVGLDHRVKVGDRIVIPGLALGRTAPRGAAPAPATGGAAATADAAHRGGQARSAGRKAGCQVSKVAHRQCAAERQSRDARGRSAARDGADRHDR